MSARCINHHSSTKWQKSSVKQTKQKRELLLKGYWPVTWFLSDIKSRPRYSAILVCPGVSQLQHQKCHTPEKPSFANKLEELLSLAQFHILPYSDSVYIMWFLIIFKFFTKLLQILLSVISLFYILLYPSLWDYFLKESEHGNKCMDQTKELIAWKQHYNLGTFMPCFD